MYIPDTSSKNIFVENKKHTFKRTASTDRECDNCSSHVLSIRVLTNICRERDFKNGRVKVDDVRGSFLSVQMCSNSL